MKSKNTPILKRIMKRLQRLVIFLRRFVPGLRKSASGLRRFASEGGLTKKNKRSIMLYEGFVVVARVWKRFQTVVRKRIGSTLSKFVNNPPILGILRRSKMNTLFKKMNGRFATVLAVSLTALALIACGGGGGGGDTPVVVTPPAALAMQPSKAVVATGLCTPPSEAYTTVSNGLCLVTDTGPVRQAAKAAPRASVAVVPPVTPDELFSWAQVAFPTVFPAPSSTIAATGFVYRYYANTNSYVAVKDDGGVYVLFANELTPQVKYVAQIEAFSCLVKPAAVGCAPVLTMTSTSPLSVAGPIVISSNQVLDSIVSVSVTGNGSGVLPVGASLSSDKLSITIVPTSPLPYSATLTVTVKATNEVNVEGTVVATIATIQAPQGAWWPPTSVGTIGVKIFNPKVLPMEGQLNPTIGGGTWQQATKDGTIQYADTGMILTGFSSKPVFLAYFIEPLGKNVCTTLVYKDDGSSIYPGNPGFGGCKTDAFDWIVGTSDGYISHFPTIGKCQKESWNVSSQRFDATEVICP